MYVIKLEFLSGLHVDSKGSGEPDVVDGFIRSDTLSSAIAIAWDILFQESPDFFTTLPYRLSSAFPYIKDILLFPIPRWSIWKMETLEPYKRKKAKSIKWISQSLFEQLITGKKLKLDEIHIHQEIALLKEEAQITSIPNPVWSISERQRVNVDRLNLPQEGGLFFFGTMFFAGGCGLYFLADVEKGCEKKFLSAIKFLGDCGIGADRNCGVGHFKVKEFSEKNIKEPEDSNGFISLSLFNPFSDEDLDKLLKHSAYSLTIRSGWITNTTYGRPPVRVFEEGSFFSEKPKGHIMKVLEPEKYTHIKLPYTVFRDFRCLSVRCKRE